MRIVCDTNVLVSGLLFGGHPRRILSMVSQGAVTGVISPMLLREAEDVLRRSKFGFRPDQVSRIVALFRDSFEIVEPSRRVNAIVRDPTDNRVLEAADAAAADAIISGDKHLLDLKEWEGIRILSPARFMEEMTGPKDFAGEA